MVSPETCDKREAAARIAVAQPGQLARDPWASHLRECPECREVCKNMAQSLAVFRQVESDRLSQRTEFGPSWEKVAAALRGEPRSRRLIRRYRLPVAAAAVGSMLFFTGASIWYADSGTVAESPARIVRLQPDQQQKMQQVVQQSLANSVATDASVQMTRPAPRLSPVEPIATEEVSAEPNGLYASGDRSFPVPSVFRRTHPFLDTGDVAATVEDVVPRAPMPMFPVMSGPRGADPVTFPIYRPSGR